MNQARLKKVLRWLHIILGLVIMCYIYSPFHRNVNFQIFVKFFVIPIITLSGVWIWKFKQLNKLFGIQK